MKGLFSIIILIISFCVQAQGQTALSESDQSALEGIIVEKYYVANSKDYTDTLGGLLPKGSITYRVYVDLKPDYTL